MTAEKRYDSFAEFYAFYLTEHTHQTSRRLHFIGSSIAVVLLGAAFVTRIWWLFATAVVEGYALAWIGHFFFERNKPATFKYPGFSFLGDWRMWWEILIGKRQL